MDAAADWRLHPADGEPRQYPSARAGACTVQHIIRASRSNISSMLLPIPSRLVSAVFILALFSAPGKAQDFAGAGEQLAARIVAAAGAKTMNVEVVNRSSLSAASADEVRLNL